MINGFFDGGESGECFAFAESGVYEESGALRLQQGDVAGATGSKNGYAKPDRFPQNRKLICAEQILPNSFTDNRRARQSRQHERRARSSVKPFNGPRTVAEICSGRKNSRASDCTSSRVTASMDARISSRV